MNKKNAAAIIDKCVLGTEGMKSNWRGNMANPGMKAEPAEKSKPAGEEGKGKPAEQPKRESSGTNGVENKAPLVSGRGDGA